MNQIEAANLKLQVNSTRRMDLAEIKAKGRWVIDNVFYMGGGWMYENDVLKPNFDAGGYLIGTMTGHHFFSCEFCGTYIKEHITIRCVETGETMNIGNQCINEFMIKSSESIMRGVESLKRKVDSDYRRQIHNEQLRGWLLENLDKLEKLHHEFIDNMVDEIKQRGYYEEQVWEETDWTPQEVDAWYANPENRGRTIAPKRARWVTVQQRPVNIKTRINFRGEEEAIEYVNPKFDEHIRGLLAGKNYWRKTNEKYQKIDWNPKTMLKSFEATVEQYNTQLIKMPKLRKLTDEERLEIGRKQQEQISLFLEKIKKIQEQGLEIRI